eukprot:538413-Prymnesium_polylepis.1
MSSSNRRSHCCKTPAAPRWLVAAMHDSDHRQCAGEATLGAILRMARKHWSQWPALRLVVRIFSRLETSPRSLYVTATEHGGALPRPRGETH